MNKFLSALVMGAIFLSSCLTGSDRRPYELPPIPEEVKIPRTFTITDYKNKSGGEAVPEWVNLYLDSGVREVETLKPYQSSYVFVYKNEGNNFNAMQLWEDNFSVELDFPRIAAARIETRVSAGVPYPDEEYGAFYEELIRAASDAPWTGASREGDFWIRKKYPPNETEDEQESWEFLILVTMEKTFFSSQLKAVFEKINPIPPPNENQTAAANRLKEQFFEKF